jgi:L-ascorbate metabolism protein UlaG (beta-lactamase superfamily)
MKITMIGHSTVLIELAGKKFLTDPYFGTWGNPAYARLKAPAKSRQELSTVDGVLISHDHWDHTDSSYLRMIGDTPVFVPKPTLWLYRLFGGRNLSGVSAWESRTIGDITVTAVPAVHMTASIGFVIQGDGRQIYFAGDTYYRPFMQEIGRRFHLDVALMPVTTYRIPMTMDEKQAVRAVQALRPSVVIPIHLGIVPRSPLLRTSQTPERFAQLVGESGATTHVSILREGESYCV